MDPPVLRRAILLSLSLLSAELGVAGLAVWALTREPLAWRGAIVGLVAACVLGVVAAFVALSVRFFGGLRRLVDQVGEAPATLELAELHELRRGLATQAALRCLVAATGSAVFAALLAQLTSLSSRSVVGLVTTTACAVGVVEAWRPALLGRLLRDLADTVSDDHGAQWRRQTLRWDLVWTGIATGAAGVFAVALFIHFFIPLRLDLKHMLLTYFPITIAVVAGLWLVASLRLMRPLRQYHQRGEDHLPELVQRVFRAVQILPYTLAGAKVLAFIAAGMLLYVEGVWLFGIDRESATLMTGATILATVAAALYEAFWHRATLRATLSEIAGAHRLDIEQVRSPLSLRVKMFGGFGLVLFFACAISIFWSFVQVRNLAVAFVQKQSKLKAEALVDRLRTQDKISGPVQSADVVGLLGQLAGAGEEVYWYLPPAGPAEGFGAHERRIPSPPFVVRSRMRRHASGVLRLGDLGLVGAYMRIRVGPRDLGSVAVLYPDQTRRPSPGPQTSALALFFLALFGLCTGIVALIASDLSAPLRALEKRAGEMAKGDLQRPVVTGAEADEVGRLAFALDDMRRSLEEQIRTVEELNVGLEEKVHQRTSDLAQANEDLREAVESLTRAQDQLVRSEKLASIGQLVAGIAHELNNPINAVGNCIDPLEASLRAFVEPTSDPGDRAGENVVEDVRGMLGVIRNGTRRIQRIVSALSSYARTDGEGAEPVDLRGVIDETLEIAAHLLADIAVERDYAELERVTGNVGQLGQVFMNLVANAAQALTGRENPRIRVITRRRGEWIEAVVSDNGPGVPPELRARIFDPFFTTKEVGQGTGLGLSLSHEIVVNHGGTLEIESSESVGATFVVRLPAG
ncbi:MAG: ATP-binding protein [bacterium]